jgi:hypothetical protein
MANQKINFTRSATPANADTITAESVNTDLNALINDYNLPVGADKIDPAALTTDVDWTNWTPTLGAVAPMTLAGTSIIFARYCQIGKVVFFTLKFTGTTGGTASNQITFTLPVAPTQGILTIACYGMVVNATGGDNVVIGLNEQAISTISLYKNGGGVWPLQLQTAYLSGSYEVS